MNNDIRLAYTTGARDFKSASVDNETLNDINLTMANFSGATIQNTFFTGSTMTNAVLSCVVATKACFKEVDAIDADLSEGRSRSSRAWMTYVTIRPMKAYARGKHSNYYTG
jgi:uncharacterized protein YjbI with pentapeptide repeats